MVVAGPLAALALLFLLVAFFYAAKLILTPMIVGILQHVPAVGRFLASAADSIVNKVSNAIGDWLAPHLITLVHWLQAAVSATAALPGAVVDLAGDIRDALNHLVKVTVPRLIHAAVADIRSTANSALHKAEAVATDLIGTEHRLQHGIEQGIRDLRDELVARFARGIDRLRNDVFDGLKPALEHDIAAAARAAEADIGRVAHDLEGVAGHLADLARRLDIPIGLIETLIAAVGIAAAVQALETLASCQGKLRTLCTSDPRVWEDFIAGLLLLAAWPGLVELAREAQGFAHAEAEAIKTVAIAGGLFQ